MTNTGAPIQRVALSEFGDYVAAARGARIVRHQRAWAVQVFDIDAKRVVFSEPTDAPAPREPMRGIAGRPFLSEDGRTVLAPVADKLYAVDTGAVVWRAGDNDWIVGYRDQRQFEMREEWKIELGRWATPFETFAVRNLRDGSLVYRSWTPTLNLFADGENKDGFILTGEGVRAIPLMVNYPLLALCQAIHALPIILIWAVLRWHRKRRMRAAGVPA